MYGRHLRTARVATRENGHLDEFWFDDGDAGVLAVAPHGGAVEPYTAEPVLAAAQRVGGAAAWGRLAYHADGAFDAWHVPSARIDPADHQLGQALLNRRFAGVLSVHGLADDTTLVGGAAPAAERRAVTQAVDATLEHEVRLVDDSHRYAGSHPANVTNRLAADGGVQLEVGSAVRRTERGALVDALVAALGELKQ